MKQQNLYYPFTAIVGQENMKEALILNLINPSLGGVLIRGEKGTAKSTLVRALVNLLGEREENLCSFHCDPEKPEIFCQECLEKVEKNEKIQRNKGKMKVVNLPVSATEDRVVGSLDIEHAIQSGEKKFEKGILAQSHRNILYVDEINLLDDHIVDLLLDAAAMGKNIIEREGISYEHPSSFVLVGTMNPEEGDLRPQLLDRFGLLVDVQGEKESQRRVEIIKRRLEFEKDPEAFLEKYEAEEKILQNKIEKSKKKLKEVICKEEMYETAAKIAIALEVDGHRADISLIKTAMTIAAYEDREEVQREDMIRAAIFVFPHRMRKTAFQDIRLEEERIINLINQM